MYEKIPTAGLSRLEWLQLRKQGIGGSDAGAVCGLNPYSSQMNVFLDKTSAETKELDSEAVRIGSDLEQYVAKRFMEATGLKVHCSHFLYRSKEHPFMIADIDRLVTGEDAGLECKTANVYQAEKWADGKVPLHYAIQCYHYMAVTGKRMWYIACVILGKEFLYRKLTWDDVLMEQLIRTEKEFWEGYVMPGMLPPRTEQKFVIKSWRNIFTGQKKPNGSNWSALMKSWNAGRRSYLGLKNCRRNNDRLSRRSSCICGKMNLPSTAAIRFPGSMWTAPAWTPNE